MENEFRKVMSERTDDELIKIVTVEKKKYQISAIEAATSEIKSRNIDQNYFEEYKDKLVVEKKEIDSIAKNQANKTKRALNFVVDSLIIFSIIYFFNKYSTEKSELPPIKFVLLLYFGYYIVLENIFGQTIGKFITNTKVTDLKGEKPNMGQIANRTLCRFIPFDPLTFFFNREGMKFHDTFSKTTVVNNMNTNIM
ncbi:hypothetical protein GCM10022393_36900 [Aquimarina addita]|uniref:RDD domain-containing protein n=1 Tax=Aquimarina addita TaxID=870485 RepID=A0ABP6UVI2_9FLAO